jgi:hypothetical protein
MKRVGFVLLLVGALASPAMAGQIQVGYPGSSYGAYQTGGGGEFTINVGDSGLSTAGYFAGARDIGVTGTFQTFCLEEDEYIYPYPNQFFAVVNTKTMNGGVNTDSGDALSVGSAYIYSKFALGDLAYNYAGDRWASADLLQKTLWWLENEGPSYDASNPYMLDVFNQFGSEADARADADAGAYGVYVLNLWWSEDPQSDIGYSGTAQDVIYHQGPPRRVPDGGSTAALLGGALLGIGAISRRFRG